MIARPLQIALTAMLLFVGGCAGGRSYYSKNWNRAGLSMVLNIDKNLDSYTMRITNKSRDKIYLLNEVTKDSKLWFFGGPASIRVQDSAGTDLASRPGSDGPWWSPGVLAANQGGSVKDAHILEVGESLKGRFRLKSLVVDLMPNADKNFDFKEWIRNKRFKLQLEVTLVKFKTLTTESFETEWIQYPTNESDAK